MLVSAADTHQDTHAEDHGWEGGVIKYLYWLLTHPGDYRWWRYSRALDV